MPRASVITAMAVKPGRCKRLLMPYRMSLNKLSMKCLSLELLVSQSHQWNDFGRASRRDVTSEQCDSPQAHGNDRVRHGITRCYFEQQSRHDASERKRRRQPNCQ